MTTAATGPLWAPLPGAGTDMTKMRCSKGLHSKAMEGSWELSIVSDKICIQA